MKFVQVKTPGETWERIKAAAEVTGQSATALANQILADSLDQMEASVPKLPTVIEVYRLRAKKDAPETATPPSSPAPKRKAQER